MLCLPTNPEYIPGEYSAENTGGASVSRSEYSTANGGVDSFKSLDGMEIPCSVCLRTQTQATVMIPGQNTCPQSFSIDYQGYLFASSPSSSGRTEYICVDANAEGIGSSSADGGVLLSPVEAGSGLAGLLLYAQGYELTCAVCGSATSSTGSVYTRLVKFIFIYNAIPKE